MRHAKGSDQGTHGGAFLGEEKRRRRMRRRNILVTSGVAIALLVFGALIYLQVRSHIIESLSKNLRDIQNSQEAVIRLWMANQRSTAQGWANEPDLRAAMLELTDSDGGQTKPDSDARERVAAGLQGLLIGQQAVGYLVVDRAGKIAAASEPSLVGRDMPPGTTELLRSVLKGDPQVTAPFMLADVFAQHVEDGRRPVVVKAAPVRNRAREPVAALIVAIDPVEFSELSKLGRFGDTGETYAINPEGLMMSQSRFLEQSKEIGLIPDNVDATTILTFQIRDPGGDLTRGYRPELPPSGLPLTLAAASVTNGEAGIHLEGYRDYRGIRVMGTWRWMDDLGFGLITEIDYHEALRPLRPLIVACASLFGLVVLAAIGLLIYGRIVQRLKSRIAEVTQLGQYTLLEKIGEGGMGKVYRARHALLARDTAVKLLKPEAVSEQTVQRFEQEVQNTAQLRHPNTVEIYDFGRTADGIFYYAMEYLDGYDLARLIEVAGQLPPGRIVHIMQQVCLSLREAHRAGLIHRDIKPMNIILCARGGEFDAVKVVDFGLVKDVAVPDRGMTAMNVIPGTPPYIAPERLKSNAAIDGRVDIYALGAVGFNMLTARQPFEGDSDLEIAYKAMHDDPRRPSECTDQDIPPALDDLILATMARNPDARPRNIEEVLERLDAIAVSVPWNRRLAAEWWEAHPPALPAAKDADRRTEPDQLRVAIN